MACRLTFLKAKDRRMKPIEKFKMFLRSNSGATAVEYALICGIFVLVVIIAISALGDANQDNWDAVSDQMSNAG